MTKILTMPAMATEGTTVCYTVTHDDLIDFAREIIERTKEMDEAEKAETSASVEDGYYTRKEVMALLKRCDSTMTKWAHAGYLVPVRVGGKHLYRKSDVDKLIGNRLWMLCITTLPTMSWSEIAYDKYNIYSLHDILPAPKEKGRYFTFHRDALEKL